MKNPSRHNKTNKYTLLATLSSLSLAISASQSFAVGLQLMPGSSNFGTAGAGHAAEGNGAGSSWANPASMSLVEGNQIGFGMIAADTDLQFEAEDTNANSGGDSGSTVVIPSFAYVHSLSDDLKLGFSVVVPFGSEIDYGHQWVGKNTVTSASVETIQAQPTFSYRINEQLSLGGGVNVNYTRAKQELSPTIDISPRLSVDADIGLDADDIAYGWTAGALWEFNTNHRVGVVYRSEVNSGLEGDADLTIDQMSVDETVDAQLNWENPASVMVSGYHQVTEKTAFLWDIGRTFYSAFETTTINADLSDGITLPIERHWQDANRYAVGTHYKLTHDLTLQAGFAYDESSVETKDRTADLPLDDIKRYTLGAMYQLDEHIGLAAGIEYADLGNGTIIEHEGVLASPAGSYDNSAVAGSLSINYKF
jgi:long-chain fatty acid transport protein